MSIEDVKVVRKYLGVLKDRLQKNCVAIAYGRIKKNGELDFQIATGFLYQDSGITVVVTSGHVFDDEKQGVKAWGQNDSLEFVSVSIPMAVANYGVLHLDSWKYAKTWTDDGFDLACIPIFGDLLSFIFEQGAFPIAAHRFAG